MLDNILINRIVMKKAKTGKKDLRVIKTDRNIRESFLRLLRSKNFESITVQNILDEALINRTTFYSHFSSKYELAEKIAEDLLAKFDKALAIRFEAGEKNTDIYEQLDEIGRILKEDREAVLAVWMIHTETIHLYDDMSSHLEDRVSRILKDKDKFQTQLAISILMTMLESILRDDNVSAAELHNEVIKFVREYLLN